VRTQQGDRLLELVARAAPAHLAIREGALVTVWETEVLAHLGDAVEFVFGQIFREPVASVVGEIEFLCYRMPVKADRVAYPARHHVRTAAIEADAPYLPIGLRWLADITR